MDKEVLDRMMMALMGASPTDDEKMASLDNQPVVQILPDAKCRQDRRPELYRSRTRRGVSPH